MPLKTAIQAVITKINFRVFFDTYNYVTLKSRFCFFLDNYPPINPCFTLIILSICNIFYVKQEHFICQDELFLTDFTFLFYIKT